MPKEWKGCSTCGENTYWIIKSDGVKCTKCETTIVGEGPFSWHWEGCSKCGEKTYWLHTGRGLEVCTRCGMAG